MLSLGGPTFKKKDDPYYLDSGHYKYRTHVPLNIGHKSVIPLVSIFIGSLNKLSGHKKKWTMHEKKVKITLWLLFTCLPNEKPLKHSYFSLQKCLQVVVTLDGWFYPPERYILCALVGVAVNKNPA